MKKATRRAIAVVIVAGAAVVAAAPGTPRFEPIPQVLVVHGGSTPSMGMVQLVNMTAVPVDVGSITRAASCDAAVTHSVASGPPFTVNAGNMAQMLILCAPGSTGMKRCIFHVNDTNGSAYFDVEGVCEYGGMPSLGPSPSGPINFGDVMVGGEAMQNMSVLNQSPTNITQMFFQTTDHDGNFKIGSPCNPDARECDATIAGVGMGSSVDFVVKCTPQSTGMHMAQLHIATNTGQYVMPPIPLACNGVSSGNNPVLSLTGNPVDAGSIEVINATGSGSVHLRNSGGGTLQITGVSITGTAAADWSYVAANQCTGGIPPTCNLTASQQVDINLTFDPSAIGSRDAVLQINYFDTAARSTTVPLDGIGRGATLDLLGGVTSIDFGTVPINVMSQVTFQLGNSGNRDLTTVMVGVTAPAGPFSVSPAMMTTVPMGGMTTITATCLPTTTGAFTTTFTASAPDAFMSPPISIPAMCEGTTSNVYSNPTTLPLGEVRTMTSPAPTSLMILATTAVNVTSFALETADPRLSVTGTPGQTPRPLSLVVSPTTDGDLANAILVQTSGGMLRIPITGRIVTASYSVPPTTALGTFCINAQTTATPLALMSTGTASFRLGVAPRMDSPTSAFDHACGTPSAYPATVMAGGQAVVTVTPKRQMTAGVRHDEVVWTTDVVGMTEARHMVSASFVDDGGAVAPSVLMFGQAPIHLDAMNARSVTLQNCDTTTIMFDDPEIDPPFTIDSAFPSVLAPNETATFSVGFRPTRLGSYRQTMKLASRQLSAALEVELSGEGITGSGDGDGGTGGDDDVKSFYGCTCSTRAADPSEGAAIGLALALALRRRRRAP